MLHIDRWKIVLVLVISILGILYATPNLLPKDIQQSLQANLPSWMPSKTVNLGLDLQGGSHLLLEADTSVVIRERMEAMEDAARTELRREGIGYRRLVTKRDGISFTLRDLEQDRKKAYQIARDLEEGVVVNIDDATGTVDVVMGEEALNNIQSQVISQSIEIVRRRIDETGTREPVIQRQGTDRIVVQLPGIEDPQRVKDLLGQTAKMTFHLVDTMASPTGDTGMGERRLPMLNSPGQTMVIKRRAVVTGEMLIDAQATFQQGAPVVSFSFNAIGAKLFCNVTRENINKPFAIVLDDKIISAPVIQSAICQGSGVITGNFTVEEANDLALLLRAGALPAPLQIVEERSVGPTLGSDSVEAGKISGLLALLLVVIYMWLSYGLFGIFANIALFVNIMLIFALLSTLQATLTLPGIAGIVLTMGIAVDTNVLIYERIREELRNGRSVISAVDSGYKNAMSTIIDANLTTLIVALLLFSFGSGPVKGFAVTMTIGTATSLFSAIMVTRLMVASWIRRARPSELKL